MIFDWLKRRQAEKSSAELQATIAPVMAPMALLGAYSELAAEHWAGINSGKIAYPLVEMSRTASVVELWNAALIESMGYLVKYSAPDPTVFAMVPKQMETITEILRQYDAGVWERRELLNPASGIWPTYDFMRKTAIDAAEATFGGLSSTQIFDTAIPALRAELPKWQAGPRTANTLPRTAIEIIADDVEAKTKLIALTLKFGRSYVNMFKAMTSQIPDEVERQKVEESMSLILVAKNPDEYWARRKA
ncbi:hypothetical protein PZ895_10865 [Mesorhizobium sp. YIM 152430]|uniref:hypothetical protein n=1 Tax=Mesorhizobium sp. YIM 152430 TaxID=3031761 RepID=UPI0023DAD6F4|nr:hypothetical protein [Mesorhizobium sp. YIM 152430]MDF1600264.1 hypothetical protein [Mesorhizobium sp. YIM 152430]